MELPKGSDEIKVKKFKGDFFLKPGKIKATVFLGSGKCRDADHYANLLIDGHCRSCKRAFSLPVNKDMKY